MGRNRYGRIRNRRPILRVRADFPEPCANVEKNEKWLKTTVSSHFSLAGAQGLVLTCRLGQRFCAVGAKVSTGHPRPWTRGFGANVGETLGNIYRPKIRAVAAFFVCKTQAMSVFDAILMIQKIERSFTDLQPEQNVYHIFSIHRFRFERKERLYQI